MSMTYALYSKNSEALQYFVRETDWNLHLTENIFWHHSLVQHDIEFHHLWYLESNSGFGE